MNKEKKTKALYAGVIIILCIIFVGLFSFGLRQVLAMEGAFPPVINAEGKTPVPESKSELISYLNRVLDDAIENKPMLSSNDYFQIDDESISTSGSDALKQNIIYFKNNFIKVLEKTKEDFNGEFGAPLNDKLKLPNITEEDVEDFACNYIYYECTSCAEGSDEPFESCELCGNPYPYALKYRDEYEFVLTIKNSEKMFQSNFPKRSEAEIKSIYSTQFDKLFHIDNLNVSYDKLELIFTVNRLTDKLTRIEYKKNMTLHSDITFTNELETAGKTDVSIGLTEGENYSLTWPGIELSEHIFSLEPKTTNNLTAKLICDNPASPDYVVKWTSSDEELFTVDDEGYIKASHKLGTGVLTASFEFQGVTYSDSCEVTVKVPAESSEISKKKLTLGVGENAELTVNVLPKDATIKTVKWYSEDEKIATVDENGIVTAVGKGKTTVYSLTDDGYFKSSCEVSVK